MQPAASPTAEQDLGVEIILDLFRDGRLEDAPLRPLDPVVGCEFQLSRAILVSQDPSDKKRRVYTGRPVPFPCSIELDDDDWSFILENLTRMCSWRQWSCNDLLTKYVNLHTFISLKRAGQEQTLDDAIAAIGITEGPSAASCVACSGLLRGHVHGDWYLSWPDVVDRRPGLHIPRGATNLPQHMVKWLKHDSSVFTLMSEAQAANVYFHPRMVFGHPHLHFYDPQARIMDVDGHKHTLHDSVAHCYLHATVHKLPRRTPGHINLPVSKWMRDVTHDAKWKVWMSYLIMCLGLKFPDGSSLATAWDIYNRMEEYHDFIYDLINHDTFLVTRRVYDHWVADKHVLILCFKTIIIEDF
jgi:hypothetical protein